MTAPKPKPTPPAIALEERDGECFARYVWHRYRFLLGDGRTLDVNAVRDDSDLREAVLAHTKAEKIVGVAVLE